MTHDEIFAMVVDGLSSTFQLDVARITPDANLYTDLDIDSIDAVDLAAKLQRQTGRRLAPETFRSVRTVRDLVSSLEVLLATPPDDVPTRAESPALEST